MPDTPPPSPLKAHVQAQMVAAMKAGDKNRTQVLRMVLSEIKRVEADKPDADPQAAVIAYAKTLRKTASEMERLNQPERVAQLQTEIAVVEEFLPKAVDDETLEKIANETIKVIGPLSRKDMGKAIGMVMKDVAAAGFSADAGKVRALLETKIGP
jgi:uncharacterized protein YqeY